MENNAIILQSQVISGPNRDNNISNSQIEEIVQLDVLNNEMQNYRVNKHDWTPKAPKLKEKTISDI